MVGSSETEGKVVDLLGKIEQRQALMDQRLTEIQEKVETLSRPPQAFSLDGAAKVLSRSVTTVKGMIRRGEIHTIKISKTRMVPMSEIIRLTALTSEPASSAHGPIPSRRERTAKRQHEAHADSIRKLARKRD